MTALLLIALAVVGVVMIAKIVGKQRREAYETRAAAHPLDPTLAAVLRCPESDWTARRAAENAVRGATPAILAALRLHAETPLLILHSGQGVFGGLLVVTPGRTLRFGGGSVGSSTDEVAHDGAGTRIMASGPRDPRPFVEIANGGRIIRFACSSLDEARLLCNVIDPWTENPAVVADARVAVTPHRVCIPDAFYADTLRAAGHPVTPFNMRSIHERFGMQLHARAVKYIRAEMGDAAAGRFTADVGRPDRDEDLPGWPARVLERWIALEPEIAHVAAFVPHHVRWFLLDTARSGGYLAYEGRPLSMWMNDWYEDDGRGARRRLGPGQPSVPA